MNKSEKIIIAIVIAVSIIVLALIGSKSNIIPQVVKDTVLGATGSVGGYSVVTTNNWGSPISNVPVILHKIIIGTANDAVYVANDTVTPSTSGVFLITATVPGTFDFETIFSQGIVANVTSTAGVIFVTSPY